MNLLTFLQSHSSRIPDRVAINHSRGSLTYSALAERVQRIANGLKQCGRSQGKVAILTGNRVEFVEIFLGAVYAGYVPVPLDPKWSSIEVNAVLRQCEPEIIFAEDSYVRNIHLPSGQAGQVEIVTLSQKNPGAYEQWIASFAPEAELGASNELLFIGFTSGTTGVPKGFMRTPLSWKTSFDATREAFQLDMKHCMAPGPLVHSLSLFALMQSLYFGATFHLVEQFHADKVLELCTAVPDMILFVVPTMIESLLQQANPGRASIQALISSGGKWSEQSKQRCREVFGQSKLYEYYGSSEASYISYMDVYEAKKPGSVGRPFSCVEISIRDEHCHEVPAGEVGQLYVRSSMMFLGYYQLSEETSAVFRDGWLKTGDYMTVDLEGYLFLAGRSQNMMITGGLNVFPEEVETVLQQLPAIQEVIVLGMPDERWGEKVTAVVQWRGDQRLSLNEVKEYCRNYLASYKAPKQLITVDRFTYTSSGKVARQQMKEYVKEVVK
ncbi:class I adenylate-forming enzyme family protein [Paenibacillus contaminans]|uniref:Acyl-CoA synthetase n=1 Tax=Paenibacillus contaminans TaxID=450362 RepID=A0A329MS79_9BACL|nr:AMP-binding protein [Paenibacillus contaminans]RAV21553.1 acyl-CoA synthetase [Paenibacillus contaminans]